MRGEVDSYNEMKVLCLFPPRDVLPQLLLDVQLYLAEIERLNAASLAGSSDADSMGDASSLPAEPEVPLTKAQIRAQRREKVLQQRRIDALQRQELVHQRKVMYGLVKSNQIRYLEVYDGSVRGWIGELRRENGMS